LTREAPLGDVGKIRTDDAVFLGQRLYHFRPDRKKLDADFLLYSLLGEDLQRQIKGFGSGSTVEHMRLEDIPSLEFNVPPLPIQRRIAGILSAYDELIENSQRRIKILESMARALYREWFVHFRFPGHESVPRVPSPLGEIPQGWEVRKLFELTKVNYGKNLPTKKLADDGAYPVYGAAKIIGRYTEYTREERTIICGCRGSVGEMQITQPRCYVTNNSFTFDPIQPDNYFWLFQTLKERGLRDVIGGAAQPQITLEGISSVELATPPFPLRTRFQQTLAPLFEQAWVLDSQTQNLRRTRDLLLPRLLSGQIDVEAMEA
jgi:type I restriction enzyme S subunit